MRVDLLPYAEQLESRPLDQVSLVVVHCTELPDLATAREYGERVQYEASGTGNSGHFYIEQDGSVHQWVPLHRIAHHVRGLNANSVGIELCNPGRYPNWLDSRHQEMTAPYPPVQLSALNDLLAELMSRLPALTHISGHEQLDRDWVAASDDAALRVRRKKDPGPQFPWDEVLAACRLTFYEPA